MNRVIIICEGETEKEFCSTILSPYFIKKHIYIQSPLIKKTMGGIVKWEELKKQISLHLNNEREVYVTTFIDYYGLNSNHGFPNWEEAQKLTDKNARVKLIEDGMKEDIEDELRYRFIPNVQLHEFEGLLFNNVKTFQEQIPPNELVGINELKAILEEYPNPEMINDNKETSPSHRLGRIVLGYDKIVYGNYLAEAIGLENIRAKCPRFNSWLNSLEESFKNTTDSNQNIEQS